MQTATGQPAQFGTWGISPEVRRILRSRILDLREAVEGDFKRQLRAIGIREDGIGLPPAGRTLTAEEERVREVAATVIQREVAGGAGASEAFEAYVRESGFTFLNSMLGFRCLEERGLLVVDDLKETVVKVDPARNASSLYWRVRNELGAASPPREVWRETVRRASTAISDRVGVLFDPESEFAALLPLQPTIQKTVDSLNDPSIPSETFGQDEILGWVYQYYNTLEKEEVNAKLRTGGKLQTAPEIVAYSCLYTERYMVDYLLQNTLGALWVEMHPESKLPERWQYFVHPAEGEPPHPREVRPLRDITVLDPACGSGHFLVRAFDLLVEMYQEEGREPEGEIAHLIIERNLHGIDIDLRAVQIAALAVYLKGCNLAGAGFRPRRLNLVPADALLPGEEPPPEYLATLRGDPQGTAVVRGIWSGLRNVREFGSLLHPERALDEVVQLQRRADPLHLRDDSYWAQWKLELLSGLQEEFDSQAQSEDLGQRLFGKDAAKGIGLVEALGRRYDVVVINPPYAGSGNLNPALKTFIEREYKEGKRDLYAAFIQRCRGFAGLDGYVGMVTQQSWLFLRSFAALRKQALGACIIATLSHLGEHAFEEPAAAGAFVALFTLRNLRPGSDHRLTAFRLVGPKSAAEKDSLLRRAIGGTANGIVSMPQQVDFLSIPETPFVYWLRPRFLELLSSDRRLRDFADVCQGLRTTDNDRFMRYMWEVVELGRRWFGYSKGGQYQKWFGLNRFVVDFLDDGQAIKESVARKYPYLKGKWEWVIGSRNRYFQAGLCYSCNCRGSLGLRALNSNFIFDPKGPAIFPRTGTDSYLLGLLSSRPSSYLLRSTVPVLDFNPGYVAAVPLGAMSQPQISGFTDLAVRLKRDLVSEDPTEMTFSALPGEGDFVGTLGSTVAAQLEQSEATAATLHAVEGAIDRLAAADYGLDPADIAAVNEETGEPAGWQPFIVGYDTCAFGIAVQSNLAPQEHFSKQPRKSLSPREILGVKTRLRHAYQSGPGMTEQTELDSSDSEDEEGEEEVLGAQIPIPAETFIEELSHSLEIHPISVYCLLREMQDQEGLVSPPLMKQAMEDYASVSVVRLLGYRWFEQDGYEQERGPILDPALVDDDGIIPLVPIGDHQTALDLIRARLERDFGPEGAEKSEQEFRQWVGRDLGEWLRRDFFRRHVQQFKQRPIAWHVVSPERTFEAFVLYHKLSRATLQDLRVKYGGTLVGELRADQARARERGDGAAVSRLQGQIEDVEEFRATIEKIERGDELKYRIRCPWTDEEADGRPGPYAPDIDDGVKVNIRPFQEAGLLAMKDVIKKW